MQIEIRLFATFREFLPPGSSAFSFTRSYEEETTVARIVEELKLPGNIPKIIIVNGIHATRDRVLQDGDVVSIFPPVAGG
jgi:molybdopterin converting factor small subunit